MVAQKLTEAKEVSKVLCEAGERRREGGGREVVVPDGPVTGVEHVHLTGALTVEGALAGQLHCL